jgi:methylenetetrahydrofolate dehydrogenase (NADP+)/methenyltetrahydrofolate cyclohydrolase
MTARIIDGRAIASEIRAGLKQRVQALVARGVRPGLAAILIGDNPASEVYVRNKTRACAEAGVHSELHRFGADCPEREVIELISRLNADAAIHGILVQLPLPPQLDAEHILQTVDPGKDVDGFNWSNLGAIVAGHPRLVPCTPLGVMTMLEREGIAVEGRDAVVLGRSVIVGKPMALMLIARGATVTVCNSKTRDLREHALRADILIAAIGRPGFVDGSMLKPGAVVIDVGINRLPGGKLTGDVDFASASQVASRITPVPGGVGRMTIAMLIANTVTAAERIAAGE